MRKLTKVINKRRKNYKPTIGLKSHDGKRFNFNAVLYYLEMARQERLKQYRAEQKAKREAREFLMDFLKKEMPEFYQTLNLFGNLGNWMYY